MRGALCSIVCSRACPALLASVAYSASHRRSFPACLRPHQRVQLLLRDALAAQFSQRFVSSSPLHSGLTRGQQPAPGILSCILQHPIPFHGEIVLESEPGLFAARHAPPRFRARGDAFPGRVQRFRPGWPAGRIRPLELNSKEAGDQENSHALEQHLSSLRNELFSVHNTKSVRGCPRWVWHYSEVGSAAILTRPRLPSNSTAAS